MFMVSVVNRTLLLISGLAMDGIYDWFECKRWREANVMKELRGRVEDIEWVWIMSL